MSDESQPTRFYAIGSNCELLVLGERWSRGEIPVCPRCGADLLVAFDWEQANKLGTHPGVTCPNDARHFEIWMHVEKRRS